MKRPEKIDNAVVNNINRFGEDLEEEREVEFFLYFATEKDAVKVEVEMLNLQFKTNVRFSEFSEEWLLFATKIMQVSTDRLADIRNWLENLAEKNNGRYDGWGTVI